MKWDLTKIFKTIEEFNEAYNYLMTFPSKAKAYEGKLNDSNSFKEFFQMQREFEEKASKLYLYAHLNSDLNKKDVANATAIAKCRMALYTLNELTSFEAPEILAIGKEKVGLVTYSTGALAMLLCILLLWLHLWLLAYSANLEWELPQQ